jgi:CHAT domain-containing protein
VAFALDALGYTWQLEGNHAAALPSFRRAAEIRRNDRLTRERTRPDDVAPHLGALLAEARRSPADRAALLAEAFVVAQLPRDGQTARALQAMAVRVAAGDPALAAAARALQDATRRRDTLRFALGQETLRPANERAPGREEALRTQVAETEQKAGELEEKLQAQFPRYGRLAASQPIPAADLASLLGPTEALVATVTSPNFTWVLLLRGGQVYAHNVRELAREKLQQEVTALRASLVPTDGKLAPFDAAAAHRLYTLLLGPYARELAGVTHLLVSPGGPLLSLPLSVLVTKPPVAGQAPHFLARDMAISVLPTVASLRELRAVAGRSTAPRPFIGFGDPAFGGGAGTPDERSLAAAAALCRRGEPMDPAVLRTMPRLPDSAVELREIAKTLGADAGSVVLGADATEARVRATDLSQYRVVVFATHGLLPGELRCQSEPALVLTPPATAASTSDDGMLDASEITQLKLDADWVLLSACNTAGSDGGLGGESLSGLTRAFLYAGARALLVSHWPVASRATTELTTGLFSVLAKDASLGRAEALRRSQLVLLNQRATAHPFFWAPFVLVGDGGGAGVASIGSPSSPPTPLPTSGGRGASTPGR